jgi:hypothetical protein
VTLNGAPTAYGARRLNMKRMSACGQRALAARAIATLRAYSPIP